MLHEINCKINFLLWCFGNRPSRDDRSGEEKLTGTVASRSRTSKWRESQEERRRQQVQTKLQVLLFRHKELLKKDMIKKRALLEKELQIEIQVRRMKHQIIRILHHSSVEYTHLQQNFNPLLLSGPWSENCKHGKITVVWKVRRWSDKFCLHCNIFIYIRHVWIKPFLCCRMVSLFHHTSPWTHRCLQSSPSAHRNGRVFRRSVQTACCYWFLNRWKFTDECKPFMVISVLMWVQ